MSVKKILVCDRHGGEHPAVTTVWMKWAGMPRIRRWDVCAEGFELITGVPMNGRPALPAPLAEPSDARRRGIGTTAGSDTAKLMRGFEAFLAKTKRRFALDEAAQSISTAGLKHTKNPGDMLKRLNPIIRVMIRNGMVERHGNFGVYSVKGTPPPPKVTTPAEIAQVVAKEIRTIPGVRVAYLSALLDLEAPVIKKIVRQLCDMGMIRTKGQRSSSRAYPVTKS